MIVRDIRQPSPAQSRTAFSKLTKSKRRRLVRGANHDFHQGHYSRIKWHSNYTRTISPWDSSPLSGIFGRRVDLTRIFLQIPVQIGASS